MLYVAKIIVSHSACKPASLTAPGLLTRPFSFPLTYHFLLSRPSFPISYGLLPVLNYPPAKQHCHIFGIFESFNFRKIVYAKYIVKAKTGKYFLYLFLFFVPKN